MRWYRIQARQVPRLNYTGQLNENRRVQLAQEAEILRYMYRRPGVGGGGGVDARMTVVQRLTTIREFQSATTMMTARRNFTFVKILGAGGNGMVVLWKWTPSGNPLGNGHFVVMKISIDTDGNGSVIRGNINKERSHLLVSSASCAPRVPLPGVRLS